MNGVVPMPATQIEPGRSAYVVLGTNQECIVEKTITGRWVLECNGTWIANFDTKREALQYCQEHPEL